jgi:hypothetical protein
MAIRIIQYIFQFIILVLIQVLILNHIQLNGYINPYIYIYFLLLLPVGTSDLLLLVIAFALGFSIDLFSSSGGIHSAATVFIAFCRPAILKLLAPRDGYDLEKKLTAKTMGTRWFLTYAAILVTLHHLALFYIEVFRFSEFFMTFVKALLNSFITLVIIFISQYLFGKTNKMHAARTIQE